ncbi:MAG: universal stress protein [Alphaproteobacteria bacterium]|nr:universal stress protein [Alphaproteobacteria bacterium]
MKRVLIAVDGSNHAERALAYVAKRRKAGERLIALALNVQPAILPSRFVPRKMIEQYQALEAEKALGGSARKKTLADLDADSYVEVGEPAETIVKFAKKTSCHEIVIGSRGLGRLKGLLLGLVATRVAQLADVPVVIVK